MYNNNTLYKASNQTNLLSLSFHFSLLLVRCGGCRGRWREQGVQTSAHLNLSARQLSQRHNRQQILHLNNNTSY
jgi:hypothetical protein